MDLSKYTTLESILDKTGDVNTAVVKQEEFKQSIIYEKVMDDTKELNIFPEIRFNQRVMYLVHHYEIKKCRFCGKQYIHFPKSQHTFALCNHKRSSTYDYSANSNERIKNTKAMFIESLNNRSLILTDDLFQEQMNILLSKKENYAFVISKEFSDFYHDLVLKTDSMISVDAQHLHISERLYCMQHKISELPKCVFCGRPVKFINRIVGYSDTCGSKTCADKKNCQTRSKNVCNLILSKINEEKYDIIHVPQLLNNDTLKIRCKKCNCESEWWLNNGHIENDDIFNRLCKNCESVASRSEEELFKYISQIYDGKIVHKFGSRKIIPPKELDIYIPDKKIAFEFNGIHWHSLEYENDQKCMHMHVRKSDACEKIGIQLIHIFENNWKYAKDLVKSKIKNLLGIYDNIVYARKCIVKEISHKESKTFLNDNHLQKNIHSRIRLGLFFENELIAVMTFGKPRFNKKYEWELLRFCSKRGYHIPGGAGKLLKYFERTNQPKSIISYADRCWSIGKVYYALGFSLDHISKPNYSYIKGDKILSRIQCQKHKLKAMFENFNENLSEFDNMSKNGYRKIYDCGNFVFVKTYKISKL